MVQDSLPSTSDGVVDSGLGHHFGHYAISSTPLPPLAASAARSAFVGGVIQRDSEDEAEDDDDDEDDDDEDEDDEDEDASGGGQVQPQAVQSAGKPRKATSKKGQAASAGGQTQDSGFMGHLAFMGAKQQGMVSQDKGKQYVGPESMKGRRTEQVLRHTGNLTLNRLAQEQSTKKETAPVEVQMSSVGGNLLVNTNNRASEETLDSGLGTAGSLQNYTLDKSALVPAMDKDKERPKRYQSKLTKALAGQRAWQKPDQSGNPPQGEDPEDIARANKILETIRSGVPSTFDLDDDEQIQRELQEWADDDDEMVDVEDEDEDEDQDQDQDEDQGSSAAAPKAVKSPRVAVVKHHKKSKIKDEHAERVQSEFRKQHLKAHENKFSSPPTGPKTPCFGCQVHHDVNHPEFHLNSPYSGAYFQGSSPVTTAPERKRALSLVTTRPATGSISQQGYLRNSDYPDSDTDDEGEPVYPRPRSVSVPFGDKLAGKRKWEVEKGQERSYPNGAKRAQVVKRFKAEQEKAKKEKAKKAGSKKADKKPDKKG